MPLRSPRSPPQTSAIGIDANIEDEYVATTVWAARPTNTNVLREGQIEFSDTTGSCPGPLWEMTTSIRGMDRWLDG